MRLWMIKTQIKNWSKEENGGESLVTHSLFQELESLDKKEREVGLST